MEAKQLTTKNIDCPQQYVSEAVGDTYKTWNRYTPIFIEAPTGSGKNTFVLNELAIHAKEQMQYILLISNRTALSQQQKQKLYNKYNSLPISRDDLRKIHRFDNILLYSYQEILPQLPKLSEYSIGYVVFDEAHFFLSDARFNCNTFIILQSLLNAFSHAVRIYMTATASQVLPFIQHEESQLIAAQAYNTVDAISLLRHKIIPELIHYQLHPIYDKHSTILRTGHL